MVDENFIIAVRFGGKCVLVDETGLSLLRSGRWYVNGGYLSSLPGNKRFHRLLLDAQDGDIVDHINGDPLDNRASNLRICSHSENMRNRKTHRNNSLGVKGVYAERHHVTKVLRYVAQIRVDGKKVVLGRFKSVDAASRAYKVAAQKLHGDFARLS